MKLIELGDKGKTLETGKASSGSFFEPAEASFKEVELISFVVSCRISEIPYKGKQISITFSLPDGSAEIKGIVVSAEYIRHKGDDHVINIHLKNGTACFTGPLPPQSDRGRS